VCAFPSGFFYVATVTYDKTNLCQNQKHSDIVNRRLMTMVIDALLELQHVQQVKRSQKKVEWIVSCIISPSRMKSVVRNQSVKGEVPETLDFKLPLVLFGQFFWGKM